MTSAIVIKINTFINITLSPHHGQFGHTRCVHSVDVCDGVPLHVRDYHCFHGCVCKGSIVFIILATMTMIITVVMDVSIVSVRMGTVKVAARERHH